MVLKAIKSSLKKNCQKKHFCQKNSMKKTKSGKKKFPEIFQSLEVQIFSEGCVKNSVFHI